MFSAFICLFLSVSPPLCALDFILSTDWNMVLRASYSLGTSLPSTWVGKFQRKNLLSTLWSRSCGRGFPCLGQVPAPVARITQTNKQNRNRHSQGGSCGERANLICMYFMKQSAQGTESEQLRSFIFNCKLSTVPLHCAACRCWSHSVFLGLALPVPAVPRVDCGSTTWKRLLFSCWSCHSSAVLVGKLLNLLEPQLPSW